MSKRVAVIDLGSNSARMVIFERTSRLGFYTLGEYKMKVRLGEGAYDRGGEIQTEAMQKCYLALTEFKKLITRYRVRKVLAVGTSALRDASNGGEFISMIRKIGINMRVISGDEEAYLGGFSSSNLLPNIKRATTIDIGGGSTELALIDNGRVVATKSLNLGTVRLKELFYDKKDLFSLEEFVNKSLSEIPSEFKCENIIAIGGSLRAISSAIMEISEYPLNLLHGFCYEWDEYSSMVDEISKSDVLDLNKYPIKKERYDTIRGGAYIFKKAMKQLNGKSVITSGVGVREGVFLVNLIGKNAKFSSGFNPSLRSLRDRFEIDFRPNIAKFSKDIFSALRPLHKLNQKFLGPLVTAAKIYDLGLRVSYYSKHSHSSYLVLNCLNYGFTNEDRALIASIIRQNGRKSISKEYKIYKKLLPDQESVIWLGFILKLAKILDDANISNISFDYANSTLEIYGLKDAIFAKESIKKMGKPGVFAITFN
ncbi:MAG: Ppx/GppA family phosphatase [Campylobacter sp.]|nr:Ppx/GppA family phosphatase [Campylobacter sp.]